MIKTIFSDSMLDNDDDLDTLKDLFTFVKRLHAIAIESNPEYVERMDFET